MLVSLLLLLQLVTASSPTLLFFVPDDSPSSTELRATIKYAIRHMSRGLWYNLDHEIVNIRQDSTVKSLVGYVREGVTAVLGAFTDDQLDNITAIVDAFNIPTFVLNQVVNKPKSPNILQTTPSVEFELESLEKVLDHYRWQVISYFVQANTSVTNLVQARGRCWDKVILDQDQIKNQTCRNFSVAILIGYSQFQLEFIDHYNRSGCRNMVVMQYFLEDTPTMTAASVRNRTEIGDLIMLFPKSYPMIDTGSKPRESEKYSCLLPSCMKFKIKNQYRQTESVLLLLDSMKLLEILLRQQVTLKPSTIRDTWFRSITGEQTALMDNGFSYNRMNIFKSGTVPGVELLGWVDETGLQIVPTTWKSTPRTRSLTTSGDDCFRNFSTASSPLSPTESVLQFNSKGPTKIITILLVFIMLIAVVTLYVLRRNYRSKVPVGLMFPYMLACLTIALTSCFVLKEQDASSCLIVILRDTVEFIFYTIILYFMISYETANKIPCLTFAAALILIKFLITIATIISRDSTEYCSISYFFVSSSVLIISITLLSCLFIILKHFVSLKSVLWILLALLLTFLSEILIWRLHSKSFDFVSKAIIQFVTVPICKVTLYAGRIFVTTLAYIFSGREGYVKVVDGMYLEDKEAGHMTMDHMDRLHCMDMANDNRELLENEHTTCRHCQEALSREEPVCPTDKVACHYVESPEMFWDEELQNGPACEVRSTSDVDEEDDELAVRKDSRRLKSSAFPERVKLDTALAGESTPSVASVRSDTYADREDVTSEDDDDRPGDIEQPVPLNCDVTWTKPQEYDSEDITCTRAYEVRCYQGAGALSGISEEEEEEEEEERQIQVGFRNGDDTNGESGFYSSNSNSNNSTEPDYVNVVNGQSILDDVVLLKAKSGNSSPNYENGH